MAAFSSSDRSPTRAQSSSNEENAKRKPPAVKNPLPPRHSSGAFSSTSTRAPCSRAESAAHMAALPPPTTTTSKAFACVLTLGHDLADLDLRRDVRVVGNVGEELLAVGAHPLLEIADRVEVEMAGADERRCRARSATRDALVDLVPDQAGLLESLAHQPHVPVLVVVVIELLPGLVGVEHADANHRGLLGVLRTLVPTVGGVKLTSDASRAHDPGTRRSPCGLRSSIRPSSPPSSAPSSSCATCARARRSPCSAISRRAASTSPRPLPPRSRSAPTSTRCA